MFSRLVDVRNHLRRRRFLYERNLFQVIPEQIFEAHARLVSINDDRPFDDSGFHDRIPEKISMSNCFQTILPGVVGREIPFGKKIVRRYHVSASKRHDNTEVDWNVPSSTLIAPGAFVFFTLIQALDGPDKCLATKAN